MTQREAYDQLRTRWPDLFPWGEHSIDSFRAYIRGRSPDAQQQAAFIELLGGPGPSAAEESAGTSASADVTALVAAISGLVDELRESRRESDDLRAGLQMASQMAQANGASIRNLESQLAALVAAQHGDGATPPPPRQ